MNVWFKVGAVSLVVSVAAGLLANEGLKLTDTYGDRASLVEQNNDLNKESRFWHRDHIADNKTAQTMDVIDAQGTVFKNIPVTTTDRGFIQHFADRPEWKNHFFFGSDFLITDQGEFSTNKATCKSWQEVLNDKVNEDDQILYSWDMKNQLQKLRNKYLDQCGWLTDKDMSYVDNEATDGFNRGEFMHKLWWLCFVAVGTIPAIWLIFWRVLGLAYRSAKNGIKGDY